MLQFKNPFEALIDLQSIFHITIFNKWMQKECKKQCNWFQILNYTKKSCFLLCNHTFMRWG